MHGTQWCFDEHAELTVDDIWQMADVADQKRQRLAHSGRQGTLELSLEDNDGLSQQACTALAEDNLC